MLWMWGSGVTDWKQKIEAQIARERYTGKVELSLDEALALLDVAVAADEIERLKAKMERFRDQHEKDYTEIERLKQGIDRWARECRIRDKEIERLRLEFYHYENENTYKGNSIRHWYDKAMAYGKSLDEMRAEIERLRSALEKSNNMIVEFIQMTNKSFECRLTTVKRAQILLDAIAREALRDEDLDNRSNDLLYDDLIAIIGRLLGIIQSIQVQAHDPKMVEQICKQVLDNPEKGAGPAGTEGMVRILQRLGGRRD